MRRILQSGFMAIAVLVFTSCSAPSYPLSKKVVIHPNGNVHLYVSNQSFAVSPVDIRVFIDGKLVVKGNFDVGDQHCIQEFVLRLSAGKHKLVAESSKGEAKLEQVFEIDEKAWASLGYWFYPEMTGGAGPTPRSFSFDVSNKPVHFL